MSTVSWRTSLTSLGEHMLAILNNSPYHVCFLGVNNYITNIKCHNQWYTIPLNVSTDKTPSSPTITRFIKKTQISKHHQVNAVRCSERLTTKNNFERENNWSEVVIVQRKGMKETPVHQAVTHSSSCLVS